MHDACACAVLGSARGKPSADGMAHDFHWIVGVCPLGVDNHHASADVYGVRQVTVHCCVGSLSVTANKACATVSRE